MSMSSLFRIAGVLLVLSAPAAGFAQKFQEPTKDELQMTSDPKAPGAPAVFLYREEITDNASHYISEYARIKVLAGYYRQNHTRRWKCVPPYGKG